MQAVTFHKCNNLKVRGVTLLNSQQMHMAFTSCEHVAVSGITVTAPADSPNTDGVHISASTHVELKDAIIGTGLLDNIKKIQFSAKPEQLRFDPLFRNVE